MFVNTVFGALLLSVQLKSLTAQPKPFFISYMVRESYLVLHEASVASGT